MTTPALNILVARTSIRASLALVLFLFGTVLTHADTFRVCWLPIDADRDLVRFCPTSRSPVPGAACRCELQSVTLDGHIGSLEVSGPGQAGDAVSTVCLLAYDDAKHSATFCPSAPGPVGVSCQCANDPQPRAGRRVTVQMLSRYFLRGNSVAEADFLKRLRECCVLEK